MANVAVNATVKRSFREYEFIAFSILVFICKSALLVRLPYREAHVNAFYTAALLAAFYCYFRFRYGITPPPVIIFFLAAAVGVDVLGNLFDLYNKEYWPVKPFLFDEFSHFTDSALSLPPAMWLLKATTDRFGLKLPLNLLAFLSVTITFSFCAYYEILELWDEKFWGDFQRLWTPQDSANDLQWDLAGIVAAALVSAAVFKMIDRYKERENDLVDSNI